MGGKKKKEERTYVRKKNKKGICGEGGSFWKKKRGDMCRRIRRKRIYGEE